MRQKTKLFSLMICILCLEACYKEPIKPVAISNYRDALIGTYSGLETGRNTKSSYNSATTSHTYTDTMLTYEISSSVKDRDALVFNQHEIYKERESLNYYLFSDSTTISGSSGSSSGTIDGGTDVIRVEFFTDKDSISLYLDSEGGVSTLHSGIYFLYTTKKVFNGLKD